MLAPLLFALQQWLWCWRSCFDLPHAAFNISAFYGDITISPRLPRSSAQPRRSRGKAERGAPAGDVDEAPRDAKRARSHGALAVAS